MLHKAGATSFVLLSKGPRAQLGPLLRQAFTHPWVTSYQIGFGPPLIKSSDRLARRLKGVVGAIDKLDAYLDVCLSDPERQRLAKLQRALLVRRLGPVEAETLDAASADVFDLSLRLHTPLQAPDKVRAQMEADGVGLDWIDEGLAPESLTARFYLHLDDPDGERLLAIDQVGNKSEGASLAVELRLPIVVRRLFLAWLFRLEKDRGIEFVDLGAPASHARVRTNGQSG